MSKRNSTSGAASGPEVWFLKTNQLKQIEYLTFGLPYPINSIELIQLNDFARFEVEQHKNQLVKYLDDGWNCAIEWGRNDAISLKLSSVESLNRIFTALSIIEQLDRLLCDFGSRILEDVLIPILKADSSVQYADKLEIMEGKKMTDELSSLGVVLKNLSVIFQYLLKHFNFELNDGSKVLQLIGHQVSDEFSKQFVNNCLKSTLPSSSSLLSSPEYLSHLENVTLFDKGTTLINLSNLIISVFKNWF